MIETSARLLQLLSLFQGRRSWAGAELAGRLGVTTRTLRRDVDKLRSLGYPIHASPGLEGGYQLGAGAAMPPLLLEDDEAVAVALGLHSTALNGVAGMNETALGALAKIEQVLPVHLARRLAALQSMVVPVPRQSEPVAAETLTRLVAACRDRLALTFGYQGRGAAPGERLVEPHRLVHTGRRWYLVAWDRFREDWRTFRVDRIEPPLLTGARCAERPPPAADLAAYVTTGMAAAPACRARVRLHLSASAAAERMPSFFGSLEPIDEARCWLDARGTCWESVALHVAFLGCEFTAEGPPELLAAFAALAARLQRAAQNHP